MDSLKEKIRYETELLRLLWATAVAGIGGTASLVLGESSPLRLLLAVVGLLVVLWLAFAAAIQDQNIRFIREELGKKEKQL